MISKIIRRKHRLNRHGGEGPFASGDILLAVEPGASLQRVS